MRVSVFDEYGYFKKFVSGDSESVGFNIGEGDFYVEAEHALYDYWYDIASEEVNPKQDFELNNLPLPCIVVIEGVSYEVTEQPTFQFDVPGVYQIHVDAGPQYYKKVFDYDYQP